MAEIRRVILLASGGRPTIIWEEMEHIGYVQDDVHDERRAQFSYRVWTSDSVGRVWLTCRGGGLIRGHCTNRRCRVLKRPLDLKMVRDCCSHQTGPRRSLRRSKANGEWSVCKTSRCTTYFQRESVGMRFDQSGLRWGRCQSYVGHHTNCCCPRT